MQHVRFGPTGLHVSRLCLGTMTFGLQCDEKTSFAILDAAAGHGITFLDTANAYPLGGKVEDMGRTEEILGKWLKGKREQFIVATKCSGKMGNAPWQQGTSRKHVMTAIDDSLRRLGTDYVDLYQVHHFDAVTPVDETVEAFDAVVKAGKARYVGVSNYHAYRVARALGRAEALGLARLVSVQPRYNLLFREIERELLPFCQEEDLAVIPYNPLAGGLLTGKHQRGAPPAGSRFTLGTAAKTYTERYWKEREFETVDAFVKLSKEAGIEPATLAVAWVLAHPAVTSPLVGASRPEQLAASVAALEVKLDAGLKAKLDEISHEYRMGDAVR
ncbi:MAG: aldo/keto reductase [Betaproteobacteria bacterium]|nr:aldo/keto reductase [Betaproteobacteria bacterium]MDH5222979.1 aldo/keto reductase [Betaproteobacteria bacterium]MDH5349758.1 aldo/keto reductase [Betaproteobacteria bacterium]